MAALSTSQALPQMVSETLTHLREGYDFLAGEMSHAMAWIDCGEPGHRYQDDLPLGPRHSSSAFC
jgi:hypothetical protein